MLHKYFCSVPPLMSSVTITIVGSTEAPMSCFNKTTFISVWTRGSNTKFVWKHQRWEIELSLEMEHSENEYYNKSKYSVP